MLEEVDVEAGCDDDDDDEEGVESGEKEEEERSFLRGSFGGRNLRGVW